MKSFTPEYQNYDSKLYEVLIVNNNSSDDTQIVATKFVEKYDNFRVIIETNQGLSHARNRAIKESNGEWIVYIDDDAYAKENFMNILNKQIELNQYDCFGGVYLPWYKFGKVKWYKDEFGSNIKKNNNNGILNNISYMDGGIMIIQKVLLEKYNGFDISLGMSGTSVAYGEETHFQKKLWQDNVTVGFVEYLIIYHLVPMYKQNLSWFLKSSYANGRDAWITFHQTPTVLKLIKLTLSILFNIIKKGVINLPRLINEKDYYKQNYVIDALQTPANSFGKLISGTKLLIGAK